MPRKLLFILDVDIYCSVYFFKNYSARKYGLIATEIERIVVAKMGALNPRK
jgi:hypothetical protein